MSGRNGLLDSLDRFLDRRLSIRQLAQLAILAGVGLGAYLVVGLFWAYNHSAHLADAQGLDKLFSALGEIVAWPVLIIADVNLR